MKTIRLFLILMLFSSFAYGETGDGEMLHKGICWFYKSSHILERYDIIDSKTMNGKTYGQIRVERSGRMGNGYEDPAGYCDTIGIRDEGGRIFVNKEKYLCLLTEDHCWSLVGEGEPLPYEETSDGEVVLYDFTKNVGDVYCLLADGTSLTVTNVSELKADDGISRRRLTLSNGFDLIEGVGCTNSPGFLLFWLNIQPSCKEKMNNFGLLTAFCDRAEDGSLKPILARDFDATVNEMNGKPNKMLTQGRRWVYDYDNDEMKGTLTYSIDGDTLLHAYKWTKVYMTLTDKETKKVVRSGYIGAFNEISKILYYLAPDSLEAIPLYDFTIGYRSFFDRNGVLRDVINDDTITVGNEKLHRIQMLNRKRNEPLPLAKDSLYYWVEGIGSSKGLLEYNAGTLMDSIKFVGCYDGENCVFTKEDFTKDSGQPLKFNENLQIGAFVYQIDLEAKTACLVHSDSYQSMNSITIPSSVELWGFTCTVDRIDDNVFFGMKNLTSVEIPSTVKTIGEAAFSGCIGLETITLPSNIATIEKEGFFGCKSLKSIVLPENLTTIKGWAFQTCLSLTEIDIPASVTYIGKYAFSHCQSLKDVYCRATTLPTTEETMQFRDNSPEATLHVPAASIEAYRKTAPWNGFKNIVPIVDMDYHPLLKVGKVWNYYYTNGYSEANMYLRVDGDTIIDGEQCFKMSCTMTDQWTGEIISQGENCVFLEKDKKVYLRQKNTWRLLYNFNQESGDVIQNSDTHWQTIDKTDFIYVMGQTFRRMKLTETDNYDGYFSQATGYWVEGIGSSRGLMTPNNWTATGGIELLVSCYEDGKCIFTGHNFEDMPSHQINTEKRSLLKNGKTWWYYDSEADAMFTEPVNFCMYLDGDTLINGTRWEKVYRNTPTPLYEKAIREDEGRVYEIRPNGNEHLLFDFTLHVGDFFAPAGDEDHSLRVIAVDTMMSAGLAHRRLLLQQTVKGVDTDLTTWIMGIGSECGIDQTALWSDQDWKVALAQHSNSNYKLMFLGCEQNGHCIYGSTPNATELAYRPFIEDDKVWEVGYGSGNPVIGGKTCKQMMRQRYVSPDYPDYDIMMQYPLLSYMGAWYEEDKKVYVYDDANKAFRMMYDFSLDDNGTFVIDGNNPPYVVGPRQTGGIKGFKGVHRDVKMRGEENYNNTTWLEGVGGIDGPTVNVYLGEENHALFLMSCTVGDEVIYLDDECEDGATPDAARKKRIDFTHTTKIKPKARIKQEKSDADLSIYGEYNEQLLGINLNPIDDAYLVRITDETGKAVYEKDINAATIVGLNIDISAYAAGRYTITVENSQESFTGEFDTQTTGISDATRLNDKEEMINDKRIYNLQGQRLSSLQKGLNIVNGQKIYVK